MTNLSPNATDSFEKSAKKIELAANDATRGIREVAHDAGSKVREFVHDTSEHAAELRKTTEEKIVENPMKAVAIAALGGIMLGALLRR